MGQASGITAAVLAAFGVVVEGTRVVANLDINGINTWIGLFSAGILAAISVAIAGWHKVQRARLDDHTLETIFRANDKAIDEGREPPFPAYLPPPIEPKSK